MNKTDESLHNIEQNFGIEVAEYLHKLEGLILDLEENNYCLEMVNEVFRVMHSIKGAAKMFGYEPLNHLAHQLEFVYDSIRNNQLSPRQEVINLTLKFGDLAQNLLKDKNMTNETNQEEYNILNADIDQLLQIADQTNLTLKAIPSTYLVAINLREGVDYDRVKTDIRMNLEECKQLGKYFGIMFLERNDSVEKFLLSTTFFEEHIRGCFIFIEDHVNIELAKLSSTDLLASNDFLNYLNERLKADKEITADLIREKINHNSSASIEKCESFLPIAASKIATLMNWMGELITIQSSFRSVVEKNKIIELAPLIEKNEFILENIREIVYSMNLVPLNSLANSFKRLVRDLSGQLNKEVELNLEGSHTEIDKNILDHLREPLLHILRNCIDHGIETKQERLASGKPPAGMIKIKTEHQGGFILLIIQDDGKGIDHQKIKQKAIAKGIIDDNYSNDASALTNLIFMPGFSTSANITDISGRGVGLDVVNQKIKDLNGNISVTSIQGQGTTFTIKIPITMSILEGFLGALEELRFIFPIQHIKKCHLLDSASIKQDQIYQTKILDGYFIQLINLRQLFKLKAHSASKNVVVELNQVEKPVGLIIDEVLYQQQFVLKPLKSVSQPYVSSVSVLGDGSLAFVLDLDKFINFDLEEITPEGI